MENAGAIPVEEEQRPWGFWATIGLSVVVMLVYLVVTLLILVAFAFAFMADNPDADIREFLAVAGTDGFISFLALCLAALLCGGLILLFIRLKATLPVGEYLGLRSVNARTALIWFALLALVLVASDLLTYALDRPAAPEIMVELYRTSRFAVLSWFAIVVAGPVFEEVFYRGFMFRGIQASALGNGGAIVITSAVWAVTHVQYDAYLMATIFVLGILLGAARAVTGSLYLVTAMHMATNLIATIGLHLFAGS